MNIVFYVGSLHMNPKHDNSGGVESSTKALAKHLSQIGNNVSIIGENVSEGILDTVTYTNNLLGTGCNLLIQVNNHYDSNIKSDVSFLWIHNDYNEDFLFGGVNEKLLKNYKQYYDKILFVSENQKNNFVERYGSYFDLNNLDILPNIVDWDLLNEDTIYNKEDICVYTSASSRGLDTLLQDWAEFKRLNPTYKLFICGPAYDYVKKDKDENLDITFLGSLNKVDLYYIMSVSRYWMYPGDYPESFCISALEAMLHGCTPVVNKSENSAIFSTIGDNYLDYKSFISNSVKENMHDDPTYISNLTKDYHNPKYTVDKLLKIYNDMINPIKVDATFIIALNLDENKINDLKSRIAELPEELRKNVNILHAIDGNNIPNHISYSLYPNWKLENSNSEWYSRNMTKGEVGCALSHYKTWELALERGHNRVLILEEDFKVEDSEIPQDPLPSDADVVYLGRQAMEEDLADLGTYVKCGYSWLLHAYILNKKSLKVLLSNDYLNRLIPVDDYVPLCYTDSEIRRDYKDYYKDIKQELNAYSYKVNHIRQLSNKKTSQTLNTDQVNESMIIPKERSKIYEYKEYLNPALLNKEFDLIVDEPFDSVLHFHAFFDSYCRKIVNLAERKSMWTEARHDYYPTYDVLLKDLDAEYDKVYTDFLNEYIRTMCVHKFKLEGKKWQRFECENFIIKYNQDKQGHLSLHHDSSDLSSVLTLNDDYTGGGTWFSRQNKLIKGKTGEMTVHPGQITHRHGARPVSSGTRYVLVSFMVASG